MNTQRDVYSTGLHDNQGRELRYMVSTKPTPDGRYAVYGQQLRDSRPFGRGSTPILAVTWAEAKTMSAALAEKHKRYLEKTRAKDTLVKIVLEEAQQCSNS